MTILAITGHGQDARATAGETLTLRLRSIGFHFLVMNAAPAPNFTFTQLVAFRLSAFQPESSSLSHHSSLVAAFLITSFLFIHIMERRL